MMKSRFKIQRYTIVILFLICIATTWNPGAANAATFKKKYPMKVGATVGMVADIVREVAKEKAQVTNIIGSGIDPHVYNPTRSDVAVLLKSAVWNANRSWRTGWPRDWHPFGKSVNIMKPGRIWSKKS